MKVKELLKELKGQFTDVRPINDKHKNAIPFTQLGKDLAGLSGKAYDKVFGEKEVIEWKLGEWKKTACWTMKELAIGGNGHYEQKRMLTIVFKGE